MPPMAATTRRRPLAHAVHERIAGLEALDGPARRLSSAVRAAIPRGAVDDALSGSWLGHALHPVLVLVPIGSWTAATLLDLVGGEDSDGASEVLLAAGVAAAAPAVLAGLRDWASSHREEIARAGLLHGLSNTTALALYGSSLAARRRGRRRTGVRLGLAGFGALTVGDWLGGNLVLAHGAGVRQTAFDRVLVDWTPALAASALAEGRPAPATAAGVELVVVLSDGAVHALADRCSECGAALHEGEVTGELIACPLNGTRYRLADGSREGGPSAYPQPAFETRRRDGRVEVRSAGARVRRRG
jgi:nitrite reductase/ring-hydroxylating ferredoxin subunit/uncharacterized membrane protein